MRMIRWIFLLKYQIGLHLMSQDAEITNRVVLKMGSLNGLLVLCTVCSYIIFT